MTKKLSIKNNNNNNLSTSRTVERHACGQQIPQNRFFCVLVKIDQIEKDKNR